MFCFSSFYAQHVENGCLVLHDIGVQHLIKDVLAENQRVIVLDILRQDVYQHLVVDNDILMLVYIIVDDLCHQLDVYKVGVLADIGVYDLDYQLVAENIYLIDIYVVGYDFEEDFVVQEYFLVLLYKGDEDVGNYVRVDMLGGVLEIVAVEELLQHFIVEDGGVVKVKIIDNHLLHDGNVENPAVILLDV